MIESFIVNLQTRVINFNKRPFILLSKSETVNKSEYSLLKSEYSVFETLQNWSLFDSEYTLFNK